MTTLLEQAKATAVLPEQKTEEQLDAEISALRSANESLFGIERISKDALYNATFRLSQDKKFLGTGYKRLSLEPLKWSVGRLQPRPVFALYAINDPVMTISNYKIGHVSSPGNFPVKLEQIYRVHGDALGNPERRIVTISSTFMGVIPAEVRPAIKKAIEQFKEVASSGSIINRVYIMAEAKNWQTKVKAIPPPPLVWLDPLVVGWDGMDLWLVTSFDLTPLENYVAKEFPALEAPRYPSLPAHK